MPVWEPKPLVRPPSRPPSLGRCAAMDRYQRVAMPREPEEHADNEVRVAGGCRSRCLAAPACGNPCGSAAGAATAASSFGCSTMNDVTQRRFVEAAPPLLRNSAPTLSQLWPPSTPCCCRPRIPPTFTISGAHHQPGQEPLVHLLRHFAAHREGTFSGGAQGHGQGHQQDGHDRCGGRRRRRAWSGTCLLPRCPCRWRRFPECIARCGRGLCLQCRVYARRCSARPWCRRHAANCAPRRALPLLRQLRS